MEQPTCVSCRSTYTLGSIYAPVRRVLNIVSTSVSDVWLTNLQLHMSEVHIEWSMPLDQGVDPYPNVDGRLIISLIYSIDLDTPG